MNEIKEKRKPTDTRRAFTIEQDLTDLENELDWTNKIIPWED